MEDAEKEFKEHLQKLHIQAHTLLECKTLRDNHSEVQTWTSMPVELEDVDHDVEEKGKMMANGMKVEKEATTMGELVHFLMQEED